MLKKFIFTMMAVGFALGMLVMYQNCGKPVEEGTGQKASSTSPFSLVVNYRGPDGLNKSMTIMDATPRQLTFQYDMSQGSFDERPGGPCSPNRINNTALRVRPVPSGVVTACRVQREYDAAPVVCPASWVSLFNASQDIYLNTNDFNYSNCAPTATSFFPIGSSGYFFIEATIGGRIYQRRIDFTRQ